MRYELIKLVTILTMVVGMLVLAYACYIGAVKAIEKQSSQLEEVLTW